MSKGHLSPTLRPGQIYTGVVIRLPEPVSHELQDWRSSLGDVQAGTVPPHITLLISESGEDRAEFLSNVREVADRWEPFHVEIRGTGTFRPVTPVVYLRVEAGYEQCVQLHRDLREQQLQSASPFDFHPHVTLAHGTTEERLDRAQDMLRTYHASFLVDHIDLYQGDEHGAWHVRERIPLGMARTDDRVTD